MEITGQKVAKWVNSMGKEKNSKMISLNAAKMAWETVKKKLIRKNRNVLWSKGKNISNFSSSKAPAVHWRKKYWNKWEAKIRNELQYFKILFCNKKIETDLACKSFFLWLLRKNTRIPARESVKVKRRKTWSGKIGKYQNNES